MSDSKVITPTPSPIVLVVEDEWLLRLELVSALAEAGWTVLEAANGEQAVQLLKEHPRIALLITDIRLGGALDGWAVAKVFRNRDITFPVIYVSANTPDDTRRLPDSVFLPKPVQVEKLLTICGRITKK